ERGWLWCETLGLWVGVWEGTIQRETAPWLRFFDLEGNLVLLSAEAERQQAERQRQRAEAERQQAERQRQQAEAERQQAERQRQQAEAERQRAEQFQQRAEQFQQRAEQAELARQRAIPRLLANGMTVEEVAEVLSLPVAVVQQQATD
ncbi:Uma2 family endonuclease, partial [Spirulina sp. CS-785/01]|nr:Uma2 family endonuclease [Spirulina sp. CS-785/01]